MKEEKIPHFNELWQNLWDFANANGTITLTAQQAREHFDYISRDVATGEQRIRDELRGIIAHTPENPGAVRDAILKWIAEQEPKKPTRIVNR